MQGNTGDHIREEETNYNVGTSEDHIENKNSEDAEQHTARDKLKEEPQTMWYKVRLLQMPERQRLPKQ
jgi:hypothetical protein